MVARKRARPMTKIDSKACLCPHRHFTEHLVGTFRKITAGEQFEPRILETFDPVTQELYRHLPTTIHTKSPKESMEKSKLSPPTIFV
jgi:hypothetical protein